MPDATVRCHPAGSSYRKPDGRKRPLGIAALEDKIVQGAVAEVLAPIYEADFLGFSYGFRPGRSQHDALDAPGRSPDDAEGELGARCRHPHLLRSCMLVPSSTTRWVRELEVLDLTGA